MNIQGFISNLFTKKTFKFDDGGRKNAGFTTTDQKDCVVRAISIATSIPYEAVHSDLLFLQEVLAKTRKCKESEVLRQNPECIDPDHGVYRKVYEPYIKSLGLDWVSTKAFGGKFNVRFNKKDLPKGRLIVVLKEHLTTMINGVIRDTYDASEEGTKVVYGYFIKKD